MRKWIAGALALIMSMALLVGCGSKDNDTKETTTTDVVAEDLSWDYIEENGKLIMGLDDSFPPMGYREDGEIVGFDVDLAKEVADRLGLELELQPIEWSAKEQELAGKNIDVIWNGFSVTPQREAELTLSDPYMTNVQSIMVLKDSDIKELADLQDKKVAVQNGSSAQEALEKAFEDDPDLFGSIEQFDFEDNVTASLDLDNGQVDALAVDSVVADYLMAQNPDKYVLLDETLAPEEFAIGFRKGDNAFRDKVQEVLDEMVADGTFAEISEKWFGRDVSKVETTDDTTTETTEDTVA